MDPVSGLSKLHDEQRAFIAAARRATLATVGSHGRPRLVPICIVLGDDGPNGQPRIYSPLDEKPKRSDDPHDLARVRDILVLPEATLLVDRWSEDWSELGWLRISGRATVVDGEASIIAALRAKYTQYAEHDLESLPMIEIVVEDVRSWSASSTDGDAARRTIE